MPKVDLNKFSIPELENLIQEIDATIKRKRVDNRRTALKEMTDIASKYGLSVDEVISAKELRKRKKVPPKYKNPEKPKQTWSGRGKRPRWIEELLAEGRTLEELEI